jgi:hypothetical protein
MDAQAVMLLGPLVVVSIGLSVWGALTVSPGAKFKARLGLGPDFRVHKIVGLVLWPMMCAFIGLGVAFVTGEEGAADDGLLLGVGFFALLVVIIGQVAGIRAAR